MLSAIAGLAAWQNVGKCVRASFGERSNMVHGQLPFANFAAVLAAMLVVFLHLTPLCCRKVVQRGIEFSSAAPFYFCELFLAMLFSVGSRIKPPSFWMSSLIRRKPCVNALFVSRNIRVLYFAPMFKIALSVVFESYGDTHGDPLIMRPSKRKAWQLMRLPGSADPFTLAKSIA